MASFLLAFFVLAISPSLLLANRSHATHWKGGVGVWHPNEEKLPNSSSSFRDVAKNATLVASPETISQGDMVVVSWSGYLPIPQRSWIGVYCPHTAQSSDYLDFIWLDNTTSITGSVRLGPIVNMRCLYEFRLFDENEEVVAISNLVQFEKGEMAPLQGRLSLTHNTDEMRVMWVSNTDGRAVVQYGPSDDDLSSPSTAIGTSHTYQASDMCGPPATAVSAMCFRHPGYMHDALMTGLKPRQKYKYRFGDGESWSEWFWFRSARPSGDPNSQVNMFAFGDLGEWKTMLEAEPYDRSYTTMWRIENDTAADNADYDLLLHVGDISYARGLGYQWEMFGRLIEPTATRIPYHVGIGNHEYDHVVGGEKDPSKAPGQGWHPSWGNYGEDSGGECAVPMVNRFHMPDGNGNRLFWYSHEYANIHFTWISTEHDPSPGSPMYEWLANDLASVNRSRTPWLFLMGHRPIYASMIEMDVDSPIDWNRNIQISQRKALEDLLFKHGVDVTLTGHYHSYERTCPVYNGTCLGNLTDPQATIHLIIGMGGALQDDGKHYDVPWSRISSLEYGYTRLSVANATHLHVEYVQNHAGNVYDDVWIVSNHTWHQK